MVENTKIALCQNSEYPLSTFIKKKKYMHKVITYEMVKYFKFN